MVSSGPSGCPECTPYTCPTSLVRTLGPTFPTVLVQSLHQPERQGGGGYFVFCAFFVDDIFQYSFCALCTETKYFPQICVICLRDMDAWRVSRGIDAVPRTLMWLEGYSFGKDARCDVVPGALKQSYWGIPRVYLGLSQAANTRGEKRDR